MRWCVLCCALKPHPPKVLQSELFFFFFVSVCWWSAKCLEMQVFSFFFKYVRGSGSPFRLALEIFKGRGASYSDSSTADDVHEMKKKNLTE